jgi:hypothetical protein
MDKLDEFRVIEPGLESFLKDVHSLLLEAGIDAEQIVKVPMFPHMMREYYKRRWTRDEFKENCMKIALFNNWFIKDK